VSAVAEAPVATQPVLEARGLTAGYGTQAVVHEVDLVVRPGEVVALLGRNGAGKTTTLLALSGELPLLAGSVLLNGVPTTEPLHRRARKGLAFVTEERSVFKGMSAGDNLRIADADPKAALELFPRLLLADELSLGLAPLVVRRLLEAVRSAADEKGTGVLLVEQHVRKALEYSDRAYVMRRGRIVMAGPAAELAGRITEIEESYFTGGDEPEEAREPDAGAPEEPT
jgi:branched-chain amino acid transport system ATP-binding protein